MNKSMMIKKDYNENLVFPKDNNLNLDNLSESLILRRSVRELLNILDRFLNKFNINILFISVREHHPYRHRFFPLDYFKDPIEIIIVPKEYSIKEVRKIVEIFSEEEQSNTALNIEFCQYLDKPSILLSKRIWYSRLKEYFA